MALKKKEWGRSRDIPQKSSFWTQIFTPNMLFCCKTSFVANYALKLFEIFRLRLLLNFSSEIFVWDFRLRFSSEIFV